MSVHGKLNRAYNIRMVSVKFSDDLSRKDVDKKYDNPHHRMNRRIIITTIIVYICTRR